MMEVGVYRVSGSALDLAKLRKSFETSEYWSYPFSLFCIWLFQINVHFFRLIWSRTTAERSGYTFCNRSAEIVFKRVTWGTFHWSNVSNSFGII